VKNYSSILKNDGIFQKSNAPLQKTRFDRMSPSKRNKLPQEIHILFRSRDIQIMGRLKWDILYITSRRMRKHTEEKRFLTYN